MRVMSNKKKTNETKATELTPTLEYKSWISELKNRYKQAQIKASVAVNGELLKFYFELGKDISEKQFANSYGSAFYKTLSSDLITEFPDAKGFSPTNLKYSFYFYDLYKAEFQNRPQVVDDLCRIPWGHHVQIIGKCKNDSKKALFYIDQIIQNNWSRNVLAKYSFESSAEPLAVSEYELAKLYPVDFKSSLPTIEEIKSELGEIK